MTNFNRIFFSDKKTDLLCIWRRKQHSVNIRYYFHIFAKFNHRTL